MTHRDIAQGIFFFSPAGILVSVAVPRVAGTSRVPAAPWPARSANIFMSSGLCLCLRVCLFVEARRSRRRTVWVLCGFPLSVCLAHRLTVRFCLFECVQKHVYMHIWVHMYIRYYTHPFITYTHSAYIMHILSTLIHTHNHTYFHMPIR